MTTDAGTRGHGDAGTVTSPLRVSAFPRPRVSADTLLATGLGLATFALYLATLTPSALRSDSGEFHVVPWVLGIAHAPGYPLLTLVGRLVMFLPIGDPAYRINLLDAAAAAAAVVFAYLAVVVLAGRRAGGRVGGLAAAAALGLGATYWQQSVVGGPRPFIFFFTALLLWLVFRWGNATYPSTPLPARKGAEPPSLQGGGWRGRSSALLLLALASGLALANHPNHLMLFPALALYLLGRDPRLLLRFRQLGLALLVFALPLLLYAYLPLRSAMNPPLGPLDLTEPRELLLYVTAAHYQDTVLNNCGGSRLIQLQRYLVFLTLQFGPLLPALAGLGALLALLRAPLAGLGLLYVFLSNATFGICSQLAMPDYVIPSFIVAAIWIGLAVAWPLGWLGARERESERARAGEVPCARAPTPRRSLALSLSRSLALGIAGLILGLSAYRVVTALPYQSMVGRATDVERARTGLAQIQPNSLVLSDWESITPIWYAQHVEGLNRSTKTALVTASPRSDSWLIAAEQGLGVRPVSLARRVPALGDKYRLFPVGSLYEVPQRPITQRSESGLRAGREDLYLVGHRLDRPVVAPGDLVRLTLYQQSERGTNQPYLPVVRLGGERPVEFRFDGALRYPSSEWSNSEVVGDVFEFSVPAWLGPGEIPLELAYRADGRDELVGLAGGQPWTPIDTLSVTTPREPSLGEPPGALANFADQLVLRTLKLGRDAPSDPSAAPRELRLASDRALDLELRWSALRWMDESYTIFVQLLDAENRVVAQDDNLPLGGIYHTYKWVPGQVITDWYRLALPAELPAGDYYLEIGAYHSVTTRRLPLLGQYGGSDRTSYRSGPLRVE